MNWYIEVFKKYAVFSGRARRKEYWMFTLFNIMFVFIAIILDMNLGTAFEHLRKLGFGLFYILYGLGVFIPALAVTVRRLHDVGKSGWMILITLIPIIGAVWLLVLMMTDGNPGENQYGPNVKDSQEDYAKTEENFRDSIILFAVIWTFIETAFIFITRVADISLANDTIEATDVLILLIWTLVPISLAFIIKNKTKKVISIILGVLFLIYGLFLAAGSLS
jgi:uncharacterized membrane protein YhaH (DUF805 family)